jgi:hypothetical protein
MPYILCGNGVKIALAERQVIDGVEHIGLTPPIVPHKAIDLGIEFETDVAKIFVIEERNLLEKHGKLSSNWVFDPVGLQK